MSEIAFTPDELRDAMKEFRGTIIDTDYGISPFGMVGRADIVAKKQLCIKIDTDLYDKAQFEWYAPSKVKMTKWGYLIEALSKTGAMKDIVVDGKTSDERVMSMAKSMIGMEFDFIEHSNLEIVVQDRKVRCILPEVYHGKKDITPITEIREEEVQL